MSDTTTTTATYVLPEDVDGRNEDRAGWAREALDAYCRATRNGSTLADSDPQEVISDFLGDLRHLIDQLANEAGLEVEEGDNAMALFDNLAASGEGHYKAETGRAPY